MSINKNIVRHQVSVVIPVYNEESEIGGVLHSLINIIKSQELPWEIIVVDDCSHDKTPEIVRKFDVQLIRHERNRGYGAALKTGIRHTRYEIIAITDGDGTYPVERLPELVGFIGEYDMAVASRTGNKIHMPLLRRFPKWLLKKYANYLVHDNIPDLNSGLRVFKKDIFEKFWRILPPGFSFTTTITLAFLSNDYQIKYLPIDYYKGGKSKIRPIRDTVNFFTLITKTSLYFNPLRIYVPIAVFLLFLGAILIVYDVFVLKDIADITLAFFLWGMMFGIFGLLINSIRLRP